MKNRVQDGIVLTLAAPYNVSSGDGFLVGTIFAVAAFTALSAANVQGHTIGVFALTKIGSQAWVVGQAIYWDNTNKRCTSIGTGNTAIGYCTEAVGSGAGETVGNVLIGVKGASNMKQGQSTTVAASDTIVTGLSKLDGVIAVLDDAPVAGCQHASGSIGDQAGTPAAGSFLLRTWKATATADTAMIAATTFSKKVNWIAWGT
jgi:predicted RecA/RadA family phage recombinase